MSFPTYASYKDSNVEWLGPIPIEWEAMPLKRLAKLITGITPPTDDQDNYSEAADNLWVRPEDIDESGYPTTASKFLSQRGWNLIRKVPPHASLVCCIGTIGKVGFTDRTVATNQQITAACFSRNERFSYLCLGAAKAELEIAATGNVLRILNSERLGEIVLPRPPSHEADAIAAFLDRETSKIDALVAEQTLLIKLLKEKRKTAISHAVTKGLDSNAPMKDSGVEWLGEVPAHWEIKRLKNLTSDIKAGPFGSALTKDMYVTTGYRVYGQEQVIPGDFTIGDYFIDRETFSALKQYETVAGDILISCVGTFGKVAIVPKDAAPGIINPRLIRLRCDSTILPQYLATVLRSDVVFEQFSMLSRGGTMDVINIGTLTNIEIAVPPTNEQESIVTILLRETIKIDGLVAEAETASALLMERRAALISAAVTGKIDVRGLAAAAAEAA
jgi:type I restriction enzyme S subunit